MVGSQISNLGTLDVNGIPYYFITFVKGDTQYEFIYKIVNDNVESGEIVKLNKEFKGPVPPDG